MKKLVKESVIPSYENRGEVEIFDAAGNSLEQMILELRNLSERTTDPRWEKALSSIINDLYTLENKMGKYSQSLGIIPLEESIHFKDFDFKVELKLIAKSDFSDMSENELESFISDLIKTYSDNNLKIRTAYTTKY